VGQNFRTWLSQFLQYANLVHIKSSDRGPYLLTPLDQPAYKAVELLKLSGSLTFEDFTAHRWNWQEISLFKEWQSAMIYEKRFS